MSHVEVKMFYAPHGGGQEFLGVCERHVVALREMWNYMGAKPIIQHKNCGICEFAAGKMERRFRNIAYLLHEDRV